MIRRLAQWSLALFVLVLLYAPMAAVAVLSLTRSRLGLAGGDSGLTFHWYARLFDDRFVLRTTLNSLYVALASTAIATLLGTFLALGRHRIRSRRAASAVDTLVALPVVTPDIIMAAALVVFFRLFQTLTGTLDFGLTTLILAHVTFQIAFVTLTVSARLAMLPPDLDHAARDLYASSWYLLTRVHIPLLLPGILGGALLAFTLSIDDFVISFFTSGPESVTLPLYIFASVKRGLSPEIHALSTLITLATILLVCGGQALLPKSTALV